jgi:hypothetical protein
MEWHMELELLLLEAVDSLDAADSLGGGLNRTSRKRFPPLPSS